MRINVAQLLRESIGQTRYHKIGSTLDNGSQIRGELKLLRTDRSILVGGTLETEARCLCSRCLKEFEQPLTLKVEEEYFPTVDVSSGVSLPIPDDAGGFVIDQNHEIDLGEAIRQYEVLAMPMKPVCRADCAGLCPHCGSNLNYGDCGCRPQALDSRWAELEKLASEGKAGSESERS